MKLERAVFAIAVCLFFMAGSCAPNDPSKDLKIIPEGVFGKWTTTNPKYKERYFNLTPDKVVFGIGEDHELVYTLARIQTKTEDDQNLITLTFKDQDGNRFGQSFYYDNHTFPVIRFKNQNDIPWQKTDPADE